MKTEDLQALGLNDEQIKAVMAENGKDVNKVQKDVEKLTADRDNWKTKAETAEGTLKGFEGKDFDAIQRERDDWKTKAEQAEKEFQQKIYDRDFSDVLGTEIEKYKFSSEYAKSAVVSEIKAAGLKLVDGKIIGLGDMIEAIKGKDASAFVTEEQENKATFTQPLNQGNKSEPITGDPEKMDFSTYKKWRAQNQ